MPAMIRWPGQIEAGVDTDELVASPDICRTLLNAAGADAPDLPLSGDEGAR